MKKIYFFTLFLFFLLNGLSAQNTTGIKQPEMMLGEVKKADFMQAPYVDWYEDEYQNYTLDVKTLYNIKDKIKGKNIIVIFGSWCSDSRREVPRFIKILDYLGVDYKKVKFIAVDRDKKAPGYESNIYNIEYVPTFIIFNNQKEIGRIIESPENTLETDLQKLLN
ncbi:MAG TPA: thioredoxin [Bacteroidetes bacterium]|jgi:thiol-disulfide isomerase/thioredoxin|nr:thioredoxin [Bacteroidota bacterium]